MNFCKFKNHFLFQSWKFKKYFQTEALSSDQCFYIISIIFIMKIYEKYVLGYDCYIWICMFWLCPINNFDFSAASYYHYHQIIIKLIGWFCAAKLSTLSWASRNKVKKIFSHFVSNLESSIFNGDAMCLLAPKHPPLPPHTHNTHTDTHITPPLQLPVLP